MQEGDVAMMTRNTTLERDMLMEGKEAPVSLMKKRLTSLVTYI